MRRSGKTPALALLIAGLSAGTLWLGSTVKATTRQGLNGRVAVSTIPVYAKAVAFLHRHVEYGVLANDITAGLRSEPERVRAIFEWTRTHIRPTPRGWTVVDDHVLHIIIRGHGVTDQMADVFTTLTTYAGMPGFWRQGLVVFSVVRVDGRWAVFDVANGLIFADASGQFIDVEELLRHPELAGAIAGPLAPRGIPYARYVERLGPFRVPEVLRARLQMPLPRLLFEAKRLLHLVPASEALPRAVRLVEASAIP